MMRNATIVSFIVLFLITAVGLNVWYAGMIGLFSLNQVLAGTLLGYELPILVSIAAFLLSAYKHRLEGGRL
jgi:divalent metal cation (Fe/Co/Zn/Cd) transporter